MWLLLIIAITLRPVSSATLALLSSAHRFLELVANLDHLRPAALARE
jgi:hypothetical protein